MRFSPDVAAAINAGARAHELEPALVAAIAFRESAGHPEAVRFEPGFRYVVDVRTWGPFRKLEAVEIAAAAPPAGWHAVFPCSEATEWSLQRTSLGLLQVMGATARSVGFQGAFLTALLDPAEGVEWGCRYLKRQIIRYPLEDAVSSFNAGHPIEGNRASYVSPVLRWAEEFRREGF